MLTEYWPGAIVKQMSCILLVVLFIMIFAVGCSMRLQIGK